MTCQVLAISGSDTERVITIQAFRKPSFRKAQRKWSFGCCLASSVSVPSQVLPQMSSHRQKQRRCGHGETV